MDNYTFDYTQIEEALRKSGINNDISFEECVKSVYENGGMGLETLLEASIEYIKEELIYYKSTLMVLLVCALISSMCVGYFSKNKENIGQASCFVSYLFMSITVVGVFKECLNTTIDAIDIIIEFVKAMIPGYICVTAFAVGGFQASGYYTLTMTLIGAVLVLVKGVVTPLSVAYLLINLSDNIADRQHFTKFKKLIKNTASTIVKLLCVLVCAANVIQKMLLPYKDQVKRQTVMGVMQLAPNLSSVLSGLADVAFASSRLLRNSIGVVAIGTIITIMSIPVIKVSVGIFILRISAAITEPISDKRISNGIEGGATAIGILLMCLLCVAGMFIISLAMASGGT